MKRRSLSLAAVLFAFAAASPLRAEKVLPSPTFAPGSGIEMRITNFYEEMPSYGFLPLRVEVKNGSAQTRKWNILAVHSQAGSRAVQFTTALEVDAGSERTFDLLVPLVTQASNGSRYSDLSINVDGYAVASGLSNDHSSVRGKPPTAFIGMGEALATKNWGPLREQLEKKNGRALDGSALDTALLPADWRGLAGFEILIFTDAEWRSIEAAEREAINDWIIQGGKLILCHTEATAPPDLPGEGELGSGRIEHWVLGDDFLNRAAGMLDVPIKPLSTEVLQNYTWQWALAEAVGRAEPPQTLIVVFVLAFALVVGPLNFLVLAPLGKRHRLFWTTPLLSIGASILMALFIFFSEGVGGSGQRIEAELSIPAARKTVIWQEQVSRTGVLLGNSFILSEKSIILQAGLRQSAGSFRPSLDRGVSFSLNGATWGGDWFRSRNTQAQVFAAVIPARGKLEILKGTGREPVAVSSFDKELKELWYFDKAGEAWRGTNLRPGEKQTLKSAKKESLADWWKKTLQPAGPVIRLKAEDYAKGGKEGKFFATTALPKPISSLPSIRWKEAGGIIFGQAAP